MIRCPIKVTQLLNVVERDTADVFVCYFQNTLSDDPLVILSTLLVCPSVEKILRTPSALEALRNALYKFKTYLLTYMSVCM